jgi:hypothetical protein
MSRTESVLAKPLQASTWRRSPRARAAASAAFAAEDDARSAAMEGFYEAATAIDDLDALLDADQDSELGRQ